MRKTFILFFSLYTMSNCAPDKGSYIQIYNNSNHSIIANYSKEYPDTSLNIIYSICELQPFSNCESYMEYEFKINSHDTLQIFITDVDTLKKYGIDTCKQEYKILKRYDLSMKELEDMNWIVNFP